MVTKSTIRVCHYAFGGYDSNLTCLQSCCAPNRDPYTHVFRSASVFHVLLAPNAVCSVRVVRRSRRSATLGTGRDQPAYIDHRCPRGYETVGICVEIFAPPPGPKKGSIFLFCVSGLRSNPPPAGVLASHTHLCISYLGMQTNVQIFKL